MTDNLRESLMRGDSDAFKEVYSACLELMRSKNFIHFDNGQDGGDMMQDILLDLWQKKHFMSIDDLSAYLFRALTNRSTDSHRRRKRTAKVLAQYTMNSIGTAYLPFSDPAEKTWIRTEIMTAIWSLPERQRQAFVLSKMESVNRRRTAALLRVSESTVHTHLHTALEKLRKRLQHLRA